MGVRNKYCSTYSEAEKENKTPQTHDWCKNWDGPSASVETDIILQGFKEVESKYGLQYTNFVGDGDSSTHPNWITGVPGWGYAIKKLECANSAIKYYRGALENYM